MAAASLAIGVLRSASPFSFSNPPPFSSAAASLSVGYGAFALPGGRLEFGESFEECARREVKEETGIDVARIEILTVVNMVALEGPNPTHFVTMIVRAEMADLGQSPTNVEPDKCAGWSWYEWAQLPQPLFGPLEDLLKGGFNPFAAFRLM